MNPIVYLTCEFRHRDLDPRMEIAAHLLNAGISVVIGQQWTMFANAGSLPRGVILFKTVNTVQAVNMENFHKAGHLVAATDEEVLNFVDDAGYLIAFREQAASCCDLFFAQNEGHKAAVEKAFPFLKGKTRIVGNPRVDALAPAARVAFAAETEEIKRQHGPYILFNTNFGSTNSIWGGFDEVRAMAVQTGDLNPDDPASEVQFKSIYAWEDRNRTEITKLVEWTRDNMPNHKIILRPHPGESPAYWLKILPEDSRHAVLTGTNPHSYIYGADLVVHPGCTTGLEAALLDKPTMNVMASRHPLSDGIVNWVNPKFPTAEEAAPALKLFLEEGKGPVTENGEQFRAALARHLPNYRSQNAAHTIANHIVWLLGKNKVKPNKKYRPQIDNFRRLNLPEKLKKKFSISQQEFVEHLSAVLRRNKLDVSAQLSPLDESLFYLGPT